MIPKIYVETSIISYLAARLSKDLIVAANQQLTQEWWEENASQFDLYISRLVIEEARAGDNNAAQKRLRLLDSLPLLDVTNDALKLANRFLDTGLLPHKASRDAAHIAIAACHGIDYLLTWNCRHLANATLRQDITNICHSFGYESPVICTPQELLKKGE
jgi:predicted nucleic acid-binding protein